MKLQHVEVIVAIVNAGSLRKAADFLGRPQPSLTTTLKQIEEDLGMVLFRRTAKGVEPVEHAKPIIEQARVIANQFARLKDTVAQVSGDLSGSLSVAVSPFASIKILPRALAMFRRRYPDVTVNLVSALFPSALQPLLAGRFDLVVGPVPASVPQNELEVEHLLSTERVLLTAAGSPYANATRIADLRDAPWTLIGAVGGPGHTHEELFDSIGLGAPPVRTTAESLFGALSIVRHLGAVCTFPKLLHEDIGPSGMYAIIPIEDYIEPIRIQLARLKGQPLTPAGDYLASCLQRQATTLREAG